MASPKVSIGLPVYNGEKYLDQAVGSLVAQTFTDFEIIISDNASTDGTRDIAEGWAAKDSRIRYLRTSENRGAAWNFNRVFDESRGDYFKWAAHDDRLAPEWLEECVAVLDARSETVLAYTRVIQVDENDDVIQHWSKYSTVSGPDPVQRIRGVFSDWQCFPVFGLIRRSALADTRLIGPYDSSDRVLLGELSARGSFSLVDRELFFHRDHPDSSMRAYESRHDRGVWFDPGKANTTTYWPNWRYHWHFGLAILRAPLSMRQTVRALVALGIRMARSRKSLISDFAVAARGLRARLRPS